MKLRNTGALWACRLRPTSAKGLSALMLTLRKASTWTHEKNTTTALKEALPHTCAEELGIVAHRLSLAYLLLAYSSHR